MIPSRWWLRILAGAVLVLSPARARADFFLGPSLVTSDGGPGAVALADMTGDGVLDLVVTATETGQILVHRGRGDGTFRVPSAILVGGVPGALAVADMDRNGQTDAVWVDEVSGEVGVLFQMGSNPVVYVPRTYRGEDEPQSLVITDMDGDTWPDVVVANRGADLVSVYYNDHGDLLAPTKYDVGDGPAVVAEVWWPERQERQFALAQNGALANNVGIYDESFLPLQILSVARPAGLSLVDWDGNLLPDLAMSDAGGRVHVYTGQSSGQFTSGVSWDVAPGASQVELMGNTGSEHAVLVLEPTRNRIGIYGGPVTGPISIRNAYFLGTSARRFLWGDTNGDGLDELLVPLRDEDNVLVMQRSGAEPALIGFPSTLSGPAPRQVLATPAAGGLPPRLAALCPPQLWIYDLSGGKLVPTSVLSTSVGAKSVRWGDFDADGLTDVVVLDETSGATVWMADGTGFAAPIPVPTTGAFRDFAVAKWGAGNALDLVLADAAQAGLRVFEGNGSGGFTESAFIQTPEVPVRVRALDLDEDGWSDLVVLGLTNTVSISYNGPTGLDDQSTFRVGDEPRGLTFDDFNGDGLPDIAVGNSGDGTYSVLVSVFARAFGFSAQDKVTPDGSQNVVSLDANGDGKPDLAFSSPASMSISMHLNTGGGIFSLPVRVRCSSVPFGMTTMDVNEDGFADVVVTDTLGDALVTLIVTPPPGGDAGGTDEDRAGTGSDPPAGLGGGGLWLAPPFPNPGSAPARLRFSCPDPGPSPSLRVYDVRGRRVRDLSVRAEGGGWFTATWDGLDREGRAVARGRYLVELRAGGNSRTRSLLLR
jgi:hypothetical protein